MFATAKRSSAVKMQESNAQQRQTMLTFAAERNNLQIRAKQRERQRRTAKHTQLTHNQDHSAHIEPHQNTPVYSSTSNDIWNSTYMTAPQIEATYLKRPESVSDIVAATYTIHTTPYSQTHTRWYTHTHIHTPRSTPF